MERYLKVVGIFLSLVMLTVSASAQTGSPTLTIPVNQVVEAGAIGTIDVSFVSGGDIVTATAFSIDYDESLLSYDDAVAAYTCANEAAFICNLLPPNLSDTDGELDFTVISLNPTVGIPDGALLSIPFLTDVSAADNTVADVLVSAAPVESYGSNLGASVIGSPSSAGSFLIVSNDAPVADDDAYVVAEDGVLNVAAPGVLDNDSDADGDSLSAVLVSDVSSGALTLNADGSFSYTPVANFNGVDSFTYQANDGTDDSNIATVTITVNAVNDPPVITLTGDVEVTVVKNTIYSDDGATAFDIEDGDISGDIIVTGTVDTSTLGQYILSYDVTDSGGNSAETVQRTVNVVTGDVPVITLNGSVIVNLIVGDTYVEAGATATDTEDGDISGDIVISGTVNTAVAGQYILNYDVTDSSDNSAETVQRIVNVATNDAPVITLNGDAVVNLVVGDTYLEAGATATDTEDGDISADIVISGAVNTAVAGQYILSYDVTDSDGNAAVTVQRTVNVATNDAPVITLNGDAVVNLVVGDTYLEAGASATDTEDGNISDDIVISGAVNTAIAGQYILSYDVTDSDGNPAETVQRTVNVTTNDAPVITLNGDAVVNLIVGDTYVEAGATATDTEDGDISGDIVISGAVNTAIAGQYILSYDVTDSDGNAAETVQRTVNVATNDAPVITLNGDAVVNLIVGDTYVEAGATATDTEDGDISGDIVISGAVNTAIAGQYILSYDVTDSDGNAAATVQRTVNVATNDAPVITLNGDAVVNLIVGDTYVEAGATATDTEDGDISEDIVISGAVNTAIAGQYILSYDVTDSDGNPAATVQRTVNVTTNDAPVITLNGDAVVNLVVGDTYVEAGATATDTEDGDISDDIVISGAVNTAIAGQYILSYDVTDSDGNAAATVQRTVNVEPNLPPVFEEIDLQVNFEGETIEPLQVIAVDPEGSDVTYSALYLPEGLSIDPETGIISGTITQTPMTLTVLVQATDNLGNIGTFSFLWQILEVTDNTAPVCDAAVPSVEEIWPPNNAMVEINILDVVDADEDDVVSIMITDIQVDDAANVDASDYSGVGTDTAVVRAERAGQGDGRTYTIFYTATDLDGATCSGTVEVIVPHDQNSGNAGQGNGNQNGNNAN